MKKFIFGLAITLFTWGIYFTRLWPNMLYWKNGEIWSGWIGVWADWAVHFTYASVFAYKPPSLWFALHPLFVGRKFTYPFVADMFPGLLIRAGLDPVTSFVIPSMIISLIFLIALYWLYYLYLKTPGKSFLALTIFLTSGGLGFIFFFKDIITHGLKSTLEFPPQEYTHIGSEFIEWINTISGQLLPQRAFLLGMTLTLFCLIFLKILSSHKSFKYEKLLIVFIGISSGFIIITHIHSYLFLLMVGFFTFIVTKNKRREISLFFVCSALVALPIYLSLYYGQVGGNFVSFHPGWLANEKSKNINFFYFWFMNWGLFLPLSLISIIKCRLHNNSLILASLSTFALSNLILFQPYDWDNSKFLTWSYLGFAIAIISLFSNLWNKNSAGKFLVPTLFTLITLSGFLDIYRLTKQQKLSMPMWTKDDLSIAKKFRQLSNPSDIVLTSDKHNHWVSTQTGRQVLLGYKGWMWTYGINLEPVDSHIKEMFSGNGAAINLLKEYKINFVTLGPSEIYDYHANEKFFQKNFPMVLKNKGYRIYKIR